MLWLPKELNIIIYGWLYLKDKIREENHTKFYQSIHQLWISAICMINHNNDFF